MLGCKLSKLVGARKRSLSNLGLAEVREKVPKNTLTNNLRMAKTTSGWMLFIIIWRRKVEHINGVWPSWLNTIGFNIQSDLSLITRDSRSATMFSLPGRCCALIRFSVSGTTAIGPLLSLWPEVILYPPDGLCMLLLLCCPAVEVLTHRIDSSQRLNSWPGCLNF